MENILCFLKSHTEPWRSFGSTFFDIDLKCTFQNALGFLLLYLCYLLLKLFLSKIWKIKNIPKHRGRVKRRRGGACRGGRICRREAEEGKKLLSIVRSPLHQQDDTIDCRQLLCPDPLCEVCNTTSAKVSRLLSWASMENTASAGSPLASASKTKSSFSPTFAPSASPPGHPPEPSPPTRSILSPNQANPSEDLFLPSPQGDSLPPEPIPPMDSKFPVDHFPPQPLAASSPPPPPHHTQDADSVIQSETILSLVGSPGELPASVPTTQSIGSASLAMSEFSLQQPPAENLSLSESAHSKKQELLALPSSEDAFGDDAAAYIAEHRNLSFLSPDVLTFLERQIKMRVDSLMLKDKEKKTDSFPKQLKPQYQLNSEGKVLESLADPQDSAVSLSFGSSKGKSEEPHVHLQPPIRKTFEVHLQQKCIPLFWGLPSLHSESLSAIVPVSCEGSSNFVCFNKISNASTAPESPVLPYPSPLPLPEIQLEPMPQTLPQSQSQARAQSPNPVLLPSPPSQVRMCGVCFHRPQDEDQSLMPSEIHQLEYNVLKKEQESMWGLPSAVQKSQGDFCPPAPSLSSVSQSSKVNVLKPILPGDFALDSELRKTLEHHLRKRLIQHRWGLPRRISKSLSQMRPQTGAPEDLDSKNTYGLSWIPMFKGQSSQDLNNVALNPPRSFHERSSEMLPLEKTVGKEQGHNPETGTKDHVLSDPQRASDNDPGSDSEKELESHSGNLSGKSSGTSGVSLGHKQLKDALEIHLSKKFEEIHECQIPGAVRSSWHSIKVALPLPEQCPSQMKHRDLAPLVGKDGSLNSPQDTSVLDFNKQKMLEDHITTFCRRITSGLPRKVQESIENFNLKENPSHAFPPSKFPSSANHILGIDTNIDVSKPLRQSSNVFHGEKVGTNSLLVTEYPLCATSPVGKEGQGTLRQSPSFTSNGLTENAQTEDGRQTFSPLAHSNIDKASQQQTVLVYRCSSDLPTGQAGHEPEIRDKEMSSNENIERPQNKMMKNLEQFPVSHKSREIFKAKEVPAFQSQPIDILRSSELESSSVPDVRMSKVETPLTTERPPTGVSVPPGPEPSNLNNQLLNELKCKMESKKHSQAQGLATHLSLASDNLISKTFPTPGQCISSGDMADSQVLHFHLCKRRLSMEQGQVSWVPTPVLCKCQNKNFPVAAKSMHSLASKTSERGGGDAGLGTSQLRRKSHPAQDRALVGRCGSQSSPALSPKGQPRPESCFRNHMKHILQWLRHGTKRKGQEASLEKGSAPSSSAHGRGLVTRTAAFSGDSKDQRVRTDTGNVVQEKVRGRHGVEKTCPQECTSVPRRPGKAQHKAEPPSATSYNQEPTLAGQSYRIKNRWIKDRDSHLQKDIALQNKQLCQRHPPSMLHGESTPHQRPICRHQFGQVPPAVPTFAEGTVLGDLSLLFKQKMLLQNFQGEHFLPSK